MVFVLNADTRCTLNTKLERIYKRERTCGPFMHQVVIETN